MKPRVIEMKSRVDDKLVDDIKPKVDEMKARVDEMKHSVDEMYL
jgi:hypothetical protein